MELESVCGPSDFLERCMALDEERVKNLIQEGQDVNVLDPIHQASGLHFVCHHDHQVPPPFSFFALPQ